MNYYLQPRGREEKLSALLYLIQPKGKKENPKDRKSSLGAVRVSLLLRLGKPFLLPFHS